MIEIKGGAQEIAEILQRGQPVFLDHYIDGCPPCTALAKVLPAIEKKFPGVIFAKIKATDPASEDWMETQENITGFPWIYLFDENGALANDDVAFASRKDLIDAITTLM